MPYRTTNEHGLEMYGIYSTFLKSSLISSLLYNIELPSVGVNAIAMKRRDFIGSIALRWKYLLSSVVILFIRININMIKM